MSATFAVICPAGHLTYVPFIRGDDWAKAKCRNCGVPFRYDRYGRTERLQ